MFFKSISPIVEFLNLKFTVKQQGEKLKVNIFFDIKEGSDEINLTPISIIATPEELDSELVSAIQGQLKQLPSIAERVNLLLSSMKEVEKSTTKKATGKTAKKTPAKKAAPKKTETPKVEEVKVEKPKEVDLFAETTKTEEPKKEEPKKEEVKTPEPKIEEVFNVEKNFSLEEPKDDGLLSLDLDEEDDLPI